MPTHDDARDASGLVAHFFRHEAARLVATLAHRFHGRIELVEDAVQAALGAALATWRRDGIPENPSAWLTRVAHNQVLDQLRRQETADRGAAIIGAEASVSEAGAPPESSVAFEGELPDDELRMLFVCCDDRLPQQTQLVLALKFLCGFSTREIAARLFLGEANVQKAIERGRAGLEALWHADELPRVLEPEASAVRQRLPVVQNVIYLLFNEGYSSRLEEQPIRRELCDEALRLGRLLVAHPATQMPTSWALLALLELHAARLDARSDGHGGLLLLEEQDRSRWDAAGIARGLQCLWRSGQGEELSRYHAEAAILAVHCTSPSFAETRWDEIVELYELLEARQPSPFHTLNRAIALAEWKGAEAGLRLLEEVAPPGWLAGHYLWDATHGELLRRLGRFADAERLLTRAEESAPTRAEREIFARKLARCRAGDQAR